MDVVTGLDQKFRCETFFVNLHGTPGSVSKVLCRWSLSDPKTDRDTSQYFRSVDVLISISPAPQDRATVGDAPDGCLAIGRPLETLARACVSAWPSIALDGGEIATKLMLVARDGFLSRCDILDVRMKHCEFVESIVHFPTPDNRFPALTSENETSLQALMRSSPGAFLVQRSAVSQDQTLRLLEDDLANRFSFQWVLPTKPVPRRVAMVGGRPLFDWERRSYGSRGPFEAAKGLGVSLIVLDRPGHWLEGDTYAHLRDSFIGIDVANETELPSIIANALEGKVIDAVVTFSDEFVIATAKAAERLHLPSEAVGAILQAHHKDQTRQVLNNPNVQTLRLQNAQQISDDPSIIEQLETLVYPLIVKPCRGGASRGVKKVHNVTMLRQALLKIEEDQLSKDGILIETYVDGPEVDANFALWDGELIFSEISDDFPCTADSANTTVDDNFVETLMVLPSLLPPAELELLRSSLHQDLLRLGFRTGVFHVEGRIQNSSRQYKEMDGVLDLVEVIGEGKEPAHQPWSFLIEVNARPPGLDCVFSTLDTYGVDMCALHYLAALGADERERFVALSTPFSRGAQYWCGNSQVPIHRDNIFVPIGFIDEVLQRLPDVAPHVSRAELFTQPGAVISPRGGAGFVAYFMLFSRKSRKHVLEMSLRVQEMAKDILDGSA
ncbi:glutathione synthetase ATP-binding domain-like protein [Apiospora arundinis]|uniref:Glutathione synthetase ATP-binding domain-like protein n=1 Tax=Apiospora arundinis TaxID=335852 RepID=A0ABR2IUC4_9PEZI